MWRRACGETGQRVALGALAVLALQGCRDLEIPPPPSHADEILRACQASLIREYATGRQNVGTVDDAATLACKLAARLDDTSYLATTAATVCAHALDAYAPPLPRTVAAARASAGTGQATCAQTQTQCGYAFFIKQRDSTSSALELLGSAGCGAAPDSTRGMLFACCVQPATVPTTPQPPGTGTTTHRP